MPKHSPPPKEIQGNTLPTGKAPAPPAKKEVINYKALLAKYIKYVEACNGCNFITGFPKIKSIFSYIEWAELEKLLK
jgi:hypothetical protein